MFRHLFERIVTACMAAGLVKGEGFAVDASVMEANASRYHGKAPDEIVWAESKQQTRAVKEYLAGLGAEAEHNPDPQATQANLTKRSLLGMGRQSQQARAVRLWA